MLQLFFLFAIVVITPYTIILMVKKIAPYGLLLTVLFSILFVTYGRSTTNILNPNYRLVLLDGKSTKGLKVLSQDMMPLDSGKNSIYIVRENYRLDRKVTIPENCIIKFEGGSIEGNGRLVGQCTKVCGDLINVFDRNLFLSGEWVFDQFTPDMFIGNDIEKVQKAFDVSIANNYIQIIINRSYNITEGTIFVDKDVHAEDEISQWSRRCLIVSGNGEGRFIKEDAGYMFSAKSSSIDFVFDKLHFRGYLTNPNDLSSIVDMRVFDCRRLGNIHVTNCSFCHCGCVYYQTGGVNTPMQGVLSMGNKYIKNKTVMRANESWNSQFIGDTVEEGFSFIKGERIGSSIRDLKVSNCCVESFVYNNTAAIDLNCNAPGLSITNCYFEANYCSIRIPRAVTGIISGNAFHSRCQLMNKSDELHCIELANLTGIDITGNNIVVDDENMYLFYFDILSPYYVQSQALVGNNGVAGKSKISNVIGKVKDLNTVIGVLDNYYTNDITDKMKLVFPQIKGGSVIITTFRGMTTISINNLVINKHIESGLYSGHIEDAKPYNQSIPVNGVIIDKDKNNAGLLFVTSSGEIGFRINYAGTYNGIVTYPHQ